MPEAYGEDLHRLSPAAENNVPKRAGTIARIAAYVFLALILEVLFSVPYRTVYLVTHSARRSWIVAILGLLFCGAVFRMRHRIYAAVDGAAKRLPGGMQSAAVTLAVGLVLRLMWVLRFHPPLASDGAGYFTEATNLAQRHFYDGTFWPPGFPLFLSPFLAVLGAHLWVAVFVGMLLFVVTTLITRRVARQITGSDGAAALAGWVLAVWPGYIAFVGVNSKEALISCMFAAMMGLLYGSRAWIGRRLWLATAGVGVLCGLAALTQPGLMLLSVAILLAEFLLTRRIGPTVLRTAVATVAMICAILPWTVRNYVAYGRIIPISSNGGSVFYRANNPNANASYSAEGEVVLPKDTIAADREGYAMAKAWIMHHPLAFATLAIRKQVVFWGDDGDGVYEGLKRNQSPSVLLYSGIKLVTSLYWFGLWLALLCFFKPLTRALDWPAWFAVAFLPLAYQWAIDSVFESGSRHHLAQISCMAVLIACAFTATQRRGSAANQLRSDIAA
jgi:4-amino-4-deoxy-L-arabinose transferase-like glycosyltransferase